MKVLKVLGFSILGLIIGAVVGGVLSILFHHAIVDDIDNLGNLIMTLFGIAVGAVSGLIAGLIWGVVKTSSNRRISTNHK